MNGPAAIPAITPNREGSRLAGMLDDLRPAACLRPASRGSTSPAVVAGDVATLTTAVVSAGVGTGSRGGNFDEVANGTGSDCGWRVSDAVRIHA